jgi:hypothetical protein
VRTTVKKTVEDLSFREHRGRAHVSAYGGLLYC